MAVIFKDETKAILDGFTKLNPSIVFKAGEPLRTVSTDERIIAQATIPETIPSDAGLGDIQSFLSNFSLFVEADVDFDDVNSKFAFVETAAGEQVKRNAIPYTDVSTITVPPLTNPDLSLDNDVEITFNANDIDKLLQAINLDKANESAAYQKELDAYFANLDTTAPSYSGAPSAPETAEGQQALFSSIAALGEFEGSISEFLAAQPGAASVIPPEAPNNEYMLDFAGTLTGGAKVTIYILKNGERDPNGLSIDATLLTPDFLDEFSFIVDPNDLKVINGVDYVATFSTDLELMQLDTQIVYQETTDNTTAFDQAQANNQAAFDQFESDAAAFEANEQKLEDAKLAIRDARLEAGGTYVAPTEQEVITYATTNFGYDPNLVEPTAPTPEEADAYTIDNTFTSTVSYWIPMTYIPV